MNGVIESRRLGSSPNAAAINDALAEFDVVRFTPGHPCVVDDGPIVLGSGKHLELPGGAAITRTASGDDINPLVKVAGLRPSISGNGSITTAAPTPRGVVRVGPGDWVDTYVVATTASSTTITAAAASFESSDVGLTVAVRAGTDPYVYTTIATFLSATEVTLADAVTATDATAKVYVQRGASESATFAAIGPVRVGGRDLTGSGDLGVVMQSHPQGGNFGTFANDLSQTLIEGVDDALVFDAQANLNQAFGVRFWKVNANCVRGTNSDEFLVVGGAVHASHGSTVARFENVLYGGVIWITAEPGGAASPYNIDADSVECVVSGLFNASGPAVDNGHRTLIMRRSVLGLNGLLGLHGATPVDQASAIADGSDAASTQASLNALLAHFRLRGDIAT